MGAEKGSCQWFFQDLHPFNLLLHYCRLSYYILVSVLCGDGLPVGGEEGLYSVLLCRYFLRVTHTLFFCYYSKLIPLIAHYCIYLIHYLVSLISQFLIICYLAIILYKSLASETSNIARQKSQKIYHHILNRLSSHQHTKCWCHSRGTLRQSRMPSPLLMNVTAPTWRWGSSGQLSTS